LSNDISGSANAYYSKKNVYKAVVTSGGKDYDYTETSSGSLAPFFGGLQKLDKYVDGLVIAFGMYARDNNLMEQDDQIKTASIARFHRTVNHKAATNYIGLSAAKRLGATLSIGAGLNYMMVDELTQDFQQVISGAYYPGTESTTKVAAARLLAQNTRELLAARAIEPTLGIQAALGTKFSAGFMFRMPIKLSQTWEYSMDRTLLYSALDDDNEPVSGEWATTDASASDGFTKSDLENTELPLGTLPWEVRTGVALFATPSLMWTFDMTYVAAVEDAEIDTFYNKEAVSNIHTGVEYYLSPSFPMRVGFFTNNDARPVIDKSEGGQRDHIDYYGVPFFLGWVQSNSQISAGAIYQWGTGEAQKVASSVEVQDIQGSMTTYAFSATHSF
jgi:hypothetical protein